MKEGTPTGPITKVYCHECGRSRYIKLTFGVWETTATCDACGRETAHGTENKADPCIADCARCPTYKRRRAQQEAREKRRG